MINYKYELPASSKFREYTVSENVSDLDPDGFIAKMKTGNSVVESVLESADLIGAHNWDERNDGSARLLYWDDATLAENDPGVYAIGAIIRTPVQE